jgi:hypothetical protein
MKIRSVVALCGLLASTALFANVDISLDNFSPTMISLDSGSHNATYHLKANTTALIQIDSSDKPNALTLTNNCPIPPARLSAGQTCDIVYTLSTRSIVNINYAPTFSISLAKVKAPAMLAQIVNDPGITISLTKNFPKVAVVNTKGITTEYTLQPTKFDLKQVQVNNLPVGVTATVCDNLPLKIGQSCVVTLTYTNSKVGQLASFKPWIYINSDALIPRDTVPATSPVNTFDPSQVTTSLDTSFPSSAQAEQGLIYAVYTIHNGNPVPLDSIDGDLPTTLTLPISISANACQAGVAAGADCKLTLALDTNQQIGENAAFSPSIVLDKTLFGSTAPSLMLPEMNATAVYYNNKDVSVTLNNNIPAHVLLKSGTYTATYTISAPFNIQTADINLNSSPDYTANVSCQPSNGKSTCTILFTLNVETARVINAYKPVITINPKQQTIKPENIVALNRVTIDNNANITVAVEKNFPAFQLNDHPVTATLKIMNNEAQLDHLDTVNINSLTTVFTITRNTCANVAFGNSCELDIQSDHETVGNVTFSPTFTVTKDGTLYNLKNSLNPVTINVLENSLAFSNLALSKFTEDAATHALAVLATEKNQTTQEIYTSIDSGITWSGHSLNLDSLPTGTIPPGSQPTVTQIAMYNNTIYAIVRYSTNGDWSSYIISSSAPTSGQTFSWKIYGKNSDFQNNGHNLSMCVNTHANGGPTLYSANALGVYSINLSSQTPAWSFLTDFADRQADAALIICDANLPYAYLEYQQPLEQIASPQVYARLYLGNDTTVAPSLPITTSNTITNIASIAAQFDLTNQKTTLYIMQDANNQFVESTFGMVAPYAPSTPTAIRLPDKLTSDQLNKIESTDDGIAVLTKNNVLYISIDLGTTWINMNQTLGISVGITDINVINNKEMLIILADNSSYFFNLT